MAIETSPALKGMDITSNISQLKGAYPQGAARKALSQILKEFVAATDADLNAVDVVDTAGKKTSILNFVKQVDSTNNLPMTSLLQKVCKDPKILAEDVLPKVQQFNSDKKWHSGAPMIRITLDLRTAQAKQKTGSNVAVGQGQVDIQKSGIANGIVAETGGASAAEEKGIGPKLEYSESWLVKVLMNDLGYKDKI
jgi:hypothetical protein